MQSLTLDDNYSLHADFILYQTLHGAEAMVSITLITSFFVYYLLSVWTFYTEYYHFYCYITRFI